MRFAFLLFLIACTNDTSNPAPFCAEDMFPSCEDGFTPVCCDGGEEVGAINCVRGGQIVCEIEGRPRCVDSTIPPGFCR